MVITQLILEYRYGVLYLLLKAVQSKKLHRYRHAQTYLNQDLRAI